MNSMDALKRKVDDLQKQAAEIEELGVKLLEEALFVGHFMSDMGHFYILDYRNPLKRKYHHSLMV